MNRHQRLRVSSISCGIILVGSLVACAPGPNAPVQADPTQGAAAGHDGTAGAAITDGSLHLLHADRTRGILAIYDDGTERLELTASIDSEGLVQSTITDHGRVVTRLVVPVANAVDLAAELGPRALAMSKDKTLAAADKDRLRSLLPVYAKAVTSLYRLTEDLGGTSLRMALPWHEEVLARLVVGEVLDRDAEAACPDLNKPLHTKLMHTPELTSIEQSMQQKASFGSGGGVIQPLCNLNCSWYNACCYHDQACVYCDHWYCGWSCVPGCFGGSCGGGG